MESSQRAASSYQKEMPVIYGGNGGVTYGQNGVSERKTPGEFVTGKK